MARLRDCGQILVSAVAGVMKKRPLLSLASDLKSAIINALANYTLMSLYGDEDSIYGTAWRLHRARALLLLCRP